MQDPQSFWDLLMSQKLTRAPFPESRFNPKAFYNPQKGRPGNIRYEEGYCISNDLEDFDAGFSTSILRTPGSLTPNSAGCWNAALSVWSLEALPWRMSLALQRVCMLGVLLVTMRRLRSRSQSVLRAWLCWAWEEPRSVTV